MLGFFTLLPKSSDFIESDDCIRKILSKSFRLFPVFIFKYLTLMKKNMKKWNISGEKARISGNCIYIYRYMIRLTRSSERIFNISR